MPIKSEKQRRLMEAAAHTPGGYGGVSQEVGKRFLAHDGNLGAGVLFVTPDQRALFVKRSGTGDHAGEWALPGGGIEEGETAIEAARREAREELGIGELLGGFAGSIETSVDGVGFTTFRYDTDDGEHGRHDFAPTLNDEHTDFVWAPLDDPPEPLHPGVRVVLSSGMAMDSRIRFALDDGSVRSLDEDGHMRVSVSNISKAAVNPYVGKEIPDWEELGLDPKKLYQMLRDPEELEKAGPTSNGKPLLMTHKPLNAAEHPYELVIGAVGTDAEFVSPFLRNSLVLWAKPGIDVVESETQKEISCGYRWKADMTPGTFEGKAYDGVMRDIVFNHVALVREGRAGPDVVVGDTNEEVRKMSKKVVLSGTALATIGLLHAYVTPKLALDAKIPNYAAAVKDLTAKNYKATVPALAKALISATKGKLAQDASLDGLVNLLDKMGDKPKSADEDPMDLDDEVAVMPGSTALEDAAVDNDPVAKIKAMLEAAGVDPAIIAKCDEISGSEETAEDEDVDDDTDEAKKKKADEEEARKKKLAEDEEAKKNMVTKQAMDAALAETAKTAAASATKAALTTASAIRRAEAAVRAYVGEISPEISFDSASGVYRHALKALGVDGVDKIHDDALPHILKAQQPISARKATTERVTMDSAAATELHTHAPALQNIRVM